MLPNLKSLHSSICRLPSELKIGEKWKKEALGDDTKMLTATPLNRDHLDTFEEYFALCKARSEQYAGRDKLVKDRIALRSEIVAIVKRENDAKIDCAKRDYLKALIPADYEFFRTGNVPLTFEAAAKIQIPPFVSEADIKRILDEVSETLVQTTKDFDGVPRTVFGIKSTLELSNADMDARLKAFDSEIECIAVKIQAIEDGNDFPLRVTQVYGLQTFNARSIYPCDCCGRSDSSPKNTALLKALGINNAEANLTSEWFKPDENPRLDSRGCIPGTYKH